MLLKDRVSAQPQSLKSPTFSIARFSAELQVQESLDSTVTVEQVSYTVRNDEDAEKRTRKNRRGKNGHGQGRERGEPYINSS
jgi:hypothetical protein